MLIIITKYNVQSSFNKKEQKGVHLTKKEYDKISYYLRNTMKMSSSFHLWQSNLSNL